MEKILIAKVKDKFEEIKKRYQEKYGIVFFDVKAENIGNVIVLEGVVLSEKQKNEIFLSVKDIAGDNKIKNKIKLLSDSKDNLEIGWAVVKVKLADIWAKLLLSGKKIIPETRATQAVKGDFVRMLSKKNGWCLVQTRDFAIGWIKFSFLTVSKRDVAKKKWLKTKRAKRGEVLRKCLSKNIQDKFLAFLKKYLNAWYVLGGMTKGGIDCSGLVEKFYSDIFGIFLPRHSADQAICGEEIEFKSAHFGDLVFLRHKATKQAHIGVVVEKFEEPKIKCRNFDSILILNARREKNGVVIEELSDILKTYNLIFIKRIIKEF